MNAATASHVTALGLLLQQIASKEAIDEAEALYSESFRAPGFLVGDDMRLREDCISVLMLSDREFDEEIGEYVTYGYGLSREEAESIVDTIRFTCIVNYKGEDEGGLEIEAMVKHLRVFHGRHDYR